MPEINPITVSRLTTGTMTATSSASTSPVTGSRLWGRLTLSGVYQHARGKRPGDDRKRDRQTDQNAEDRPKFHDRIVAVPLGPG